MPPASSLPGPFARLLAGSPVRVAELDPDLIEARAGLFPQEAEQVERAVESRQKQYTAGRILARRAWGEIGVGPLPLLNDERRVPIWPEGLVGSITHTRGWCAAAVARAADVTGLGVDVEAASPLEHGLWERVCRPEERAFLDAQPAAERGLLAKVVFSAKESIYKALYPRIRTFLDFQGMSVQLAAQAPGHWAWHAELQVPWGELRAGERFAPGLVSFDADFIRTAIVLAHDALNLRG
jgi:4'-phosphopantetheinyl transferase EntD